MNFRFKIKCKHCNNEFETDYSNKKYCSQECYDTHRTVYLRERQREKTRLKRGTYNKWIRELRKKGYLVLSPQKLKEISQ